MSIYTYMLAKKGAKCCTSLPHFIHIYASVFERWPSQQPTIGNMHQRQHCEIVVENMNLMCIYTVLGKVIEALQ